MKKVLFLMMLVALMMYVPFDNAEASKGEGPPPGYQQVGPAIVGTIVLDGYDASFTGQCKGNDINVSVPWPTYLNSITKENVENFVLMTAGPAGCHSDYGGEDIIIHKVTKFNATLTAVVADVVILFLVPK